LTRKRKEATAFYTSLFPVSKVTNMTIITGTPSGDCDIVSLELAGQKFMAISAGRYFKFTPAISYHVKCPTKDEVDALWAKLSEGGLALMPLGSYPFSERYGWTNDKYGLSWQIIYGCDTQEEIDYYWEKPFAVPEAEQCGWLKAKYGVSWQLVPSAMDEMMGSGDKAAMGRVTQAFLKMKKFIIADLEKAYNG
jgi:predicted 3-demethylubiquinone-9 3-methyltransferase (glyoxalase superfamily)